MAILAGAFEHITNPFLDKINAVAPTTGLSINYDSEPMTGNCFSFYAGRWSGTSEDTNMDGSVRFTMFPFPNSLDYVVSCYTSIIGFYQGKGLAQDMMDVKCDLARMWGAKAMLAQVFVKNDREIHILEKTGWKGIHVAAPDRMLSIYVKDLYDQPTDPNQLFGGPS